MIIKLLKYKPYSNRENIGFDVVSSYEPYVVQTFNGVNFIPGDGVNTTIICNTSEANSSADYLLAVKDDGTTIDSRWFVMDAARYRQGQYKFNLYRDTLYDFKTEIANSTAYIKRGWITDSDNPLLFNQEEFTTNQILNHIDTLQQGSHGAWVVGYLSPNAEGGRLVYDNGSFTGPTINSTDEFVKLGGDPDHPETTFSANLIVSGNAELFLPSAHSDGTNLHLHLIAKVSRQSSSIFYDVPTKFGDYGSWSPQGIPTAPDLYDTNGGILAGLVRNGLSDEQYSKMNDDVMNSAYKDLYRYDQYSSWNNEIVYWNEHYYRASISPLSFTRDTLQVELTDNSIKTTIANLFNGSTACAQNNLTASSIAGVMRGTVTVRRITFTDITSSYAGTYNATIPEATKRPIGTTQPYSIFAIPCGRETLVYNGTSITTNATTANKSAFTIAQEISKKYTGSGALYDLQLLPYCPIKFTNDQVHPNKITWIFDSSNNRINGICWVSDVEIKNYGALDLTWHNPVTPNETALNLKVINQLYSCRIVAPNHGAMYEFNPARLGSKGAPSQAAMSLVSISLTYKPYAPLIFIKPKTWQNGLYGQTYDTDTRGLICAGDFSLPQTNDAWQTYQINNKNYLNAFNRQVESVELNNKYTKVKDIAGAISGTVSAAVSGGITGAAVGGPAGAAGAAVGAIAGGLASGVAGALDVGMNEKLRADQLDLKKDMFNFDLQNIQAQPQTIAKVGAYDVLNSVFPLVETYQASGEEEAAFRQYLKYNGMKIGVISTLSNYKVAHRFISADIININLHEDTHLINTIREEVSKGFYDGRITNI